MQHLMPLEARVKCQGEKRRGRSLRPLFEERSTCYLMTMAHRLGCDARAEDNDKRDWQVHG